MILGKVMGTVEATTIVPGMTGVKLLWVQPITGNGTDAGQAFIACDGTQQAGIGEIVFMVDGREAGLALPDPNVPADVTIVGIAEAIQ